MEVCALTSGSSGNCFYIENQGQAILVDVGISTKKVCERLEMIGKKPENIKGIFVSHEHSDHIRGVDVLARKFNIPIFATEKTVKSRFLCSNEKLINYINKKDDIKIAGMEIEVFSKFHSAIDPVSFTIVNGKRVSVITDVGHACKNVCSNVSDADFLFLESNHDIEMLEKGPYPYHLKRWIKSDEGHLSNVQAALCVLEYANPRLQHVILSHLSDVNNEPAQALRTFNSLVKERKDLKLKSQVSGRHKPTEVFRV
ncbi:MAG: MBL fold metallo-hydrolase [Nanoarchaeota archaeon]|nr:MBL fold metallo-hydrolase [Nanoarchaeota archaeon]